MKIYNCLVCQKEFTPKNCQLKRGNGKFCSRSCANYSQMIGNKRAKGMKPNQTSFKQGFTPWNKGLRGVMAGEVNGMWKGGTTSPNRKIRTSTEYKLWREAVFIRDNYTCVWCGQYGGNLEADHVKPFCDYPELRLAIDNGRTLCKKCHKTTETHSKKART